MDGTDSQGRIQTSDSDPRTGMYHQMRVTLGDAASSMNVI